MRNLTSIIAVLIFLTLLAPAQTKYRVIVIGSSTAAGVGASDYQHSWVGLAQAHYKALGQLRDDTIINMAVPGSYSIQGVDTIPWVLARNPDIVLVSYPSNDIAAGVNIHVFLGRLRQMYQTFTTAGKMSFVATTQPRDFVPAEPGETLLKEARDSIVAEFPGHFMQFYDPLVAPGSYDINPLYTAEGTHPNDAGHQLLYQAALAAQILPSSPLPLVLTAFSGRRTGSGVVLSWSASDANGNTDFFIESSTDGTTYKSIDDMKTISDGTTKQYSFTDQNPSAGKSFYRIRAVTNGNAATYSTVLTLEALTAGLTIQKIYITSGRRGITTTIDMPKDGSFQLAIFNTAGIPVKQQSCTGRAPAVTLDVPLSSLPAGIYFLQATTPDGQRTIKPFTIL